MFTSKHRGICWDKNRNRWMVRIISNNKLYCLGRFKTEEEAIKVRMKFIEENKNNLSDRTKNIVKQRENLPKDKNNLYNRVCMDCGKIDKFKNCPTKLQKRCKDCGIKFKSKKFDDIDIVQSYNNELSLRDIGRKYNTTGDTIKRRLIKYNISCRDREYCLSKANNKIKQLCETGEFQKRASARQQGIPIEKWERFAIKENLLLYKNSEYRQWRRNVLKRDKYQCQICYKIFLSHDLHAHHIIKKAKRPDLMLDPNNGITLCKEHHFPLNNKEHEYEQFFLNILKISV
jgi:hypothetical protein